MTFDLRSFGSDFRAWRQRCHLEMKSTAEELDIGYTQLCRYELGQAMPRLDEGLRMAQLAGMDVESYLGDLRPWDSE